MSATIKDQLQSDLGDAMKGREEITVATIRLALAAIKKAEVAGDTVFTLTDQLPSGACASEYGCGSPSATTVTPFAPT